VSYIVIHPGSSGQAAFQEFDDLAKAVSHLEDVCNAPGGADARLCKLEPMTYEVKQYFKVEFPGDRAEPDDQAETVEPDEIIAVAEPFDPPLTETATVFEPLAIDETSDLEPHGSRRDSHLTGESRRGLFGR